MNIEIVDVTDTVRPSKKDGKPQEVLNVTFRDESGKVDAKDLYKWATDKALLAALSKATKGEFYSVEREKTVGGFWNWTAVARQDAAPQGKVHGSLAQSVPTRSNYETPEERAQRQIYIIRQNALTNATSLIVNRGGTIDEIWQVAESMVSWVMGKPLDTLLEDIPQ